MSRRRLAVVALCAVIVIVGGWMLARTDHSESAPKAGTGTGESTCPKATLPHEVVDTVRRIRAGGPFPFPRSDGAVFTNHEGHLPNSAGGTTTSTP